MAPGFVAACVFSVAIVFASGLNIRGGHVDIHDMHTDASEVLNRSGSGESPPLDSGVCWRNTGGTCVREPCFDARGPTECIDARCYCAPGFCSNSSGICTRQEGRLIGSHAIRSLTHGLGNGFGARPKYLGIEYGFKPFNHFDDAWFGKGPDFYTVVASSPQQWLFYDIGDGYVHIEPADAPGYWLAIGAGTTGVTVRSKLEHGRPSSEKLPVTALNNAWKITGDQEWGFKIFNPQGMALVRVNTFRLFPQMKTSVEAEACVLGFYVAWFLIVTFCCCALPKSIHSCWGVFIVVYVLVLVLWTSGWVDPDYGVALCWGDATCMGREEFLFDPPLDPGAVDRDGVWEKPSVIGNLGDNKTVMPWMLAFICLAYICCCCMMYHTAAEEKKKESKQDPEIVEVLADGIVNKSGKQFPKGLRGTVIDKKVKNGRLEAKVVDFPDVGVLAVWTKDFDKFRFYKPGEVAAGGGKEAETDKGSTDHSDRGEAPAASANEAEAAHVEASAGDSQASAGDDKDAAAGEKATEADKEPLKPLTSEKASA